MTISVAAGAVAEAIAPSVMHMGRSKPGTPHRDRMISTMSTISTAPSPSQMVMTTGFVPMRFK